MHFIPHIHAVPLTLKSSERFTAEKVCKFLGLNDDYSNSSSSSSSNTNSEDKELCYTLSDNNQTISESDNEEEIIPRFPKRIKTIIGNKNILKNANYENKEVYNQKATEEHSI